MFLRLGRVLFFFKISMSAVISIEVLRPVSSQSNRLDCSEKWCPLACLLFEYSVWYFFIAELPPFSVLLISCYTMFQTFVRGVLSYMQYISICHTSSNIVVGKRNVVCIRRLSASLHIIQSILYCSAFS